MGYSTCVSCLSFPPLGLIHGLPGCLLLGAFVAAFPFSAALGGGEWPLTHQEEDPLMTDNYKEIIHRVENYHHRLPNLKNDDDDDDDDGSRHISLG